MNNFWPSLLLVVPLALTGCGAKDDKPVSTTGSAPTASPSATAAASAKAAPTVAQQAIIDGGSETKWDEQGLTWKLPAGWPKMQVSKESLNYGAQIGRAHV